MNEFSQKSLNVQLADLPRDVPPPRNLWPAIAGRQGTNQGWNAGVAAIFERGDGSRADN